MKLYKTILAFAVASLPALTFISCEPYDYAVLYQEKETYHTYWYIANDTGAKVYFRVSDDTSLTPILLYPDASYPMHYLQNREEAFYGFDVMEPNIGGNSLHFFVEDGSTPVKTWRADEKGDPGKQFFNEAYWELEIADSGTAKIWTFHIEPDDIQQD